MDGAALLLALGVAGVRIGWQPMPDDRAKYEYVVHVDQRVADDLARGKHLPQLESPPDDVAPIGRVRIVVDASQPPRRRLVTTLKPAMAETAGIADSTLALKNEDPLLLAQYTPGADGRYVAPISNYDPQSAAAAAQRFVASPNVATESGPTWNAGALAGQVNQAAGQAADQLRAAGQDAANAASNSLRQLGQNATPSVERLFSGASGNAASGSAASSGWNGAAADPYSQTVNGNVQQAAQPIRDGLKRIESGVQNATGNLGNRTRELLNDLRPSGAPVAAGPTQFAAPAPESTAGFAGSRSIASNGSGSAQGSSWNEGAAATSAPPYSSPPTTAPPYAAIPQNGGQAATGGSAWNNSAPAAGAATAASGSAPRYPAGNGASGTMGRIDQQLDPRSVGRFNTASQPGGTGLAGQYPQYPNGASAAASAPSASTPTAGRDSWNAGGVAAPSDAGSRPPGVTLGDSGPQFPIFGGANATPRNAAASTAATPVLDSRALTQPASRPLEGPTSDALAVAPTTTATPSTPALQYGSQPPPQNPALVAPTGFATNTPPYGSQSGAGWLQTAAARAGYGNGADNSGALGAPAGGALATLAAWVLLTGSVAGNLYLFWSYLDVRNKYRVHIRRSARAAGSRLTAA